MKQFRNTNYFVDKFGNIFNAKGKKLKPFIHKGRNSEYLKIKLNINNNRCGFRVHRIVAEVYLLNPENKPEVHHIDANTFNNKLENLMWVTSHENKKFKKR